MPIYLDHAATTPLRAEALDAYVAAATFIGNPSSIHSQGQRSKQALEEAREVIAETVGADSVEITFTSGGTEAVNLGIKGLYWWRNKKALRPRVLLSGAEHHATMDSVSWLESHENAQIQWIPVDSVGRIDLSALEETIASDPDSVALITTLVANNEVGTLEDIAGITAIAARHGIPVHADAIAAFGLVELNFHDLGLAAMSISAHKVGGPVSAGALVLARSADVVPLIHGGGQQRGRSGTQDVPGAAAFAAAARITMAERQAVVDRMIRMRDTLIARVARDVPAAILQGDPINRLPGNAHFTFPGCEGDSMLYLLDVAGFSVSTGSACTAGVPEASHVLMAMGLSEDDARGAIRVTLGASTTSEEVDAFAAALPAAYLRAHRAGLARREV